MINQRREALTTFPYCAARWSGL